MICSESRKSVSSSTLQCVKDQSNFRFDLFEKRSSEAGLAGSGARMTFFGMFCEADEEDRDEIEENGTSEVESRRESRSERIAHLFLMMDIPAIFLERLSNCRVLSSDLFLSRRRILRHICGEICQKESYILGTREFYVPQKDLSWVLRFCFRVFLHTYSFYFFYPHLSHLDIEHRPVVSNRRPGLLEKTF